MGSDPAILHASDTAPLTAPLAGRRVVVLATGGVPHPTRGASTVLFFFYMDRLVAAGADVDCHLLLTPGSTEGEAEAAELAAAVGAPDRFATTIHRCPAIVRQHRFAFADDSAAVAAGLGPIARDGAPADALVCLDWQAAAVGRHLPAAVRTVWLGDLAFQALWHHALYTVAERPMRLHELAYARVQVGKLRRAYADILRGYDPVIVSSHSSEAALAALGIASSYAPYPWPPLAESTAAAPAAPTRPTFLFFGNLTGLGSRSSLHMLVEQLVPRLRALWGAGGFAIRIAGRATLADDWRRKIDAIPEIAFLGFVDDLHAEIRQANAVLAPLDVPVGNRSRILTALSVAAPLIAHRNAALGNPDLVDGDTCYLAADADRFVAHMRACVDDPARAAAIARAGQAMYRRRFAPDASANLFAEILCRRFAAAGAPMEYA